MPRHTRRRGFGRRRGSRRGHTGGFWPFNAFFAPDKTGPTGAPNTTGTFTETSYGIPGLIGTRTFTNSQGKTMTQKTGIPQNIAMFQFATQPHPDGLFGTKGKPTEATTGAPYPYYPGIIGVNPDAPDYTPAKLQAAYNAKKNTGTNAEKKTLKNAFNTFSDPQKLATYRATMKNWYAQHPPTMANIIAMGVKGPGGMNLSAIPF